MLDPDDYFPLGEFGKVEPPCKTESVPIMAEYLEGGCLLYRLQCRTGSELANSNTEHRHLDTNVRPGSPL